MKPIRTLVVDDAVVVRRMIADVLGADPAIEVAGSAANGLVALQEIAQVTPDVVTLDVEMPEGLETLRQIRRTHPKLPVIVFSAPTERGAAATLDALSLGASESVIKPVNVASVGAAIQRIREELVPKIKALGAPALASGLATTKAMRAAAPLTALTPVTPVPAARAIRPPSPIEAIGIGVSAGGPQALAELIPALPADLPAPVLIVQHMPPVFTRLLADRLNARSRMPVVEAAADLDVRPGHVYLAPGGFHLTVRRLGTRVLTGLNQEPAENSCRPAVDVLFRAMSRVYGAGTLAVVLTGMGQDGLRGSEHIVSQGGRVLAQDEASSLVWGMPGFVACANLADRVLPLARIADEIVRRTVGAPVRSAIGR